jgi:hypothetical protein
MEYNRIDRFQIKANLEFLKISVVMATFLDFLLFNILCQRFFHAWN